MSIERKYGRIFVADERDKEHKLRAAATGLPVSKYWYDRGWLADQGSEGSCHIEGTEVLTQRGWLDFRQVTDEDVLATVNPISKQLEFQIPTARQCLEFDGELVACGGLNLRFAVTPDHRMWRRKWDESIRTLSDEYDFVTAEKMGWYSGLLAAPVGCSVYTEVRDRRIGDATRGQRVSADALLEFMGIFLAEGCLYDAGHGNYRVEIAAVKLSCRGEVKRIVSALGFHVVDYPDRYTIYSKALFEFLKEAYQTGARTKQIPRWIVGATPEQLRLFLDAFALGDGHDTKNGRRFYWTSSRAMADALQEIYLRLGIRTTVVAREPRDVWIKGRLIAKENVSLSYVVSPWRKTTLSIERKQLQRIPYHGAVYCATVPNGTLVTRYEGRVLISGNCVGHGWAHWLHSSPFRQYLDPRGIYHLAQFVDEWNGENYEGTSVRAGAKVLAELGAIGSYKWTWQASTVARHILTVSPVVIGVEWYEGMAEPADDGVMNVTGELLGGHCVCLVGYSSRTNQFKVKNSWGTGWGKGGYGYLYLTDLQHLLDRDGEACVGFEQALRPS